MIERLPSPSAHPERVLVVDDDDADRRFSIDILEKEGFSVQRANSGWVACEMIAQLPFDLIVTDIVMPRGTGFEVIQASQKANPEVICIAMTGHGTLDSAMDALRLGAYSYLTKPCDPDEFRHCIRRGLEKQRLTKELRLRNAELEKLNRDLDAKVQDATRELMVLNRRMLTEMASLQEVDQLKSAFLDNVTHDLKNPLSAILGYVNWSLEYCADMPEEFKTCLTGVARATNHMEYLISQLLEAAQLTSGKIRLDLESVAVREILEESTTLIRGQAELKKIQLKINGGSGSGLSLRGDRGRLLQILNNLIGNACKFTPEGGSVTLRAWPEDQGVHFCVEDTGSGIALEHHKRIFERFYQIERTSSAKTFRGLGLGLRIARDLVELHGGRIWVESEPNKGSRFHFTIPS